MRQKYKSSIIITTKKNNKGYHQVETRDNDDYMKKIEINIHNLSEIKGRVVEDHMNYIEAMKGRKEATTKISIETKVK